MWASLRGFCGEVTYGLRRGTDRCIVFFTVFLCTHTPAQLIHVRQTVRKGRLISEGRSAYVDERVMELDQDYEV